MSLAVLVPGTHSLLVDGGRPASRGLGIPVGGPADRAALMMGNALVGNPSLAPALEITLAGPTLLAEAQTGICLLGAPFRIDRDGEELVAGHTFTLSKGQSLRIGGTPVGCRAYLCVPGGFQAAAVMESVTAFAPVQAGDLLHCAPSWLPGRSLDDWPAAGESRGLLRCLPGPQADWFDDALFQQPFRVTPASNRMGVRLEGAPLSLPKRELTSEPVAPGAVQVTNDGQPIVLGVDGQTIGGYPKIAHVITADLGVLGQLRPGDEVRFQRVSEEEAEEAAARQRDELRKWLHRIAVAIG